MSRVKKWFYGLDLWARAMVVAIAIVVAMVCFTFATDLLTARSDVKNAFGAVMLFTGLGIAAALISQAIPNSNSENEN